MQIHNLKRKTPNKETMLVGRGGKRGKTSGRGTKGQNSRAGRKKRPEMRDIIKKYPKLRGYAFKSTETKPVVINLGDIENTFADGDKITRAVLIEKKLVSTIEGKIPQIKILAQGDITKKVTIEGCTFSTQAKEKVEKAGGKFVLNK